MRNINSFVIGCTTALVAQGCGGQGGDQLDRGHAGSGGASTSTDGNNASGGKSAEGGNSATGGCDLSKPFGTPVMIVESLGLTQGEHSMSVSDDGLSAVVAVAESERNYKLKHYVRSSITESFKNQEALNGDASVNIDGFVNTDPRLARDGLSLFFTASKGGKSVLAYSSRESTTAPFGPWVQLDVGDSQNSAPWIDAENKVLYWASTAGILRASASFAGSVPQFSGITEAIGFREPGTNVTTFALTDDQLTMYYSSNPDRTLRNPGMMGSSSGYNGYDEIWIATSTALGRGWNSRVAVKELDQFLASHYPTDVSPDGCIIYFRAKPNALLDFHLYQAVKPQ
jgi:hypothetical protein